VEGPRKTFAELESGEMRAVFFLSPDEAAEAAADEPGVYEMVHRSDSQRSFLGLSVRLTAVSEDRVRELLEHAWRHRLPGALCSLTTEGDSDPRARAIFQPTSPLLPN
jgi:hypothetical protein